MAVTITPRLGITRWSAASDQVTRAQFDASAAAIEALAAIDAPAGTFADRPAAGTRGRYTRVADTGVIYRDSGTGWDVVGGALEGTATVTATAGQTADLAQWRSSAGAVLARVTSGGRVAGAQVVAGVDPTVGTLRVGQPSTGAVAAVIRAFAASTANLLEWQSSAGAVLASVSAGGALNTNTGVTGATVVGTGHVRAGTPDPGAGALRVSPPSPTTVGTVVRGAVSQTAALSEWQTSAGTVIASVDAAGALRGANAIINNVTSVGDSTGVGGPPFNSHLSVTPTAAANKGIVVRGTTAQSANLTEWQNAAGGVLAKFNANGLLSIAAQSGVVARGSSLLGLNASAGAPAMSWDDGTRTAQIGMASQGSDFVSFAPVGAICLVLPSGGTVMTNGSYTTTSTVPLAYAPENTQLTYASNGAGGVWSFIRPGVAYSTIQAAAFSVVSSAALKENVADTGDGLAVIRALRVVDFNYRASAHVDDHRHTGLLAEETADVYAPAVTVDADGAPVGIDYSKIVGPLLRAVQQLADRVDALEAECRAR